jgi:hypothetical protein
MTYNGLTASEMERSTHSLQRELRSSDGLVSRSAQLLINVGKYFAGKVAVKRTVNIIE